MRKSIDGLSLIVAETLEMDPFSESWFIFCNRTRDKLKILFWDTNGFWLYYRRLEKGPSSGQDPVRTEPFILLSNNWVGFFRG
ncbi:IS66 family insertion sequence element accessory protein TnpB [Providencia rettgeri]|uniref:IS66 family insertion sequence element accessory protein TnpB n=1 Tax=Providencia rettgeri TaxID=587 RepID=A0A939SN66_PRORE|nr:IS66 family insertion sequence element accessory protein TnpB [Providencia rettgeri]MBO1928599.1 IS66 family insertion sequence element accessory protein TnpB [Providencia rettgeri]